MTPSEKRPITPRIGAAAFAPVLKRWILDPARLDETPEIMLHGLTSLLNEAGWRIITASCLVRTMHPQFELLAQRWRPMDVDEIITESTDLLRGHRVVPGPAGVVDVYLFAHGHSEEDLYRSSPFFEAHQAQAPVRCAVRVSDSKPRFPILTELAARGATDYLVLPIVLPEPFNAGLSFASDHPEGFPAGVEDLFQSISSLLALVIAFRMERLGLFEILAAYLGRIAAKKVVSGQVVMGQASDFNAVIGFTELAGYRSQVHHLSEADQTQVLDTFFGTAYAEVTRAGGDILKYMGESVLYVFPLTLRGDGSVAQRALSACQALQRKLRAQDTLQRFSFTPSTALHSGTVMLGNAGAPGRLDFTVLGDAVNTAARLQDFAAQGGHELVLSAQLAEQLSTPAQSLGYAQLKGLSEAREVFVADDA